MSKLLSLLIAAAFATASFGSFAASHGGAPKDAPKMEEAKPAAKADEMKPAAKKKMSKKKAEKKMEEKK
jgi:hypothetical protein